MEKKTIIAIEHFKQSKNENDFVLNIFTAGKIWVSTFDPETN